MQITARKFFAYTLLPQIRPRIRSLTSGFTFVAYFLAQIYRAVGLLPADHPYLSAASIGKFGISHVISEAGLILKRKNAPLDQKIVYWALMTGLVVLMMQFLLMLGGIFMSVAHAADTSAADWGDIISQPGNWFVTKDPTNDLAFSLLDRVFGLKDFFNSCVAQNKPCFGSDLAANNYYNNSAHTGVTTGTYPNAYHLAMHSVFQLYSVALLVIAAIILVYFIGAVVAETAQTGAPFGNRFNKTWAPIRLVLAFGLLIPIANGLNAAQYITLYAAKFGSGFATNGWNMFVDTAVTGDNTVLGDKKTLVALTQPPPITTLYSFMALVGACKMLTEKESELQHDDPKIKIEPYLINPNNTSEPFRVLETTNAQGQAEDSWDFDDALKYSNNGTIIVRFGEYRVTKSVSSGSSSETVASNATPSAVYTQSTSNVNPTCGEITVPVTNTDKNSSPGAYKIMNDYFSYLGFLWIEATEDSSQTGTGMTGNGTTVQNSPLYQSALASLSAIPGLKITDKPPTTDQIVSGRESYQQSIETDVTDAGQQQQNSQSFQNMATQMEQYGWGGAGLWYTKLAQLNSSLVAAIYNLPQVTHFPQVMEDALKQNQQHNVETSGSERFRPHSADKQVTQFPMVRDNAISDGLIKVYDEWNDSFSKQNVSNNVIINAINAMFGSSGLFSMSQNQAQDINPLAELVAVGRGILESATRNLTYATVAGIGGGVIGLGVPALGGVGVMLSGIIWSVALLGLSIGIVLTYILPLMPFLYFFFAVGGWIKAVFEAMVGVPLWALAHLRIDGPGLPGDAAMGGYYLLLDIFLRPILIIFGLLGGLVIFVAQATVLNEIWPLVTSNLVGFNRENAASIGTDATGAMRYLRDALDQLFFSFVYAVVIYMLGMASFKMVDQVPSYVLRWMGASASGFTEENETPQYLMGQAWQTQQLMRGMGGEISPANLGSKMQNLGGQLMSRNKK